MLKRPILNKNLSIQTKQQLARLEAFTKLNPRPIIEIDFKGDALDINASAQEFFPDLKKKGKKHPYLSDLKEVIRELKKDGKVFRREIKIKNKWFKQLFFLVPNFNLIHVYGSDVTDRKQAEQALRESEGRYRMLFQKMGYGYALQDIIFDSKNIPQDYRFIDVNPAFEKMTKLKKESIIGKTATEISGPPKTTEAKKIRKDYDMVAVTGKPIFFESYNPVSKKYFQLYAYRPSHTQMALIFSDITRQKKMDEEKNNFISIMSHELRNPLTPIMTNAQFINSLLQRQKNPDPAIKESIDVIEKQSKIMADLLNDILDVSRLSRNKITLTKKKVDVCEIIKSSIKTSLPFIDTKNQTLDVFFSHDAIYMHADPLRLEQIMVNVINNASKYTPPQGHITIHCSAKEKELEIRVKDNGVGMNPEKIEKIFELFSDESQSFMGIGGLGIGLNIVKNLVSMHKGTIKVTSRGKNKGSEFTITFPLPAGQWVKNVKKIPVANTPVKKGASRILVVDDNPDIRKAVSRVLEYQGYMIKSAHNGLDAISIAKSFKPETALIDIGLPDINGYKVATALRKQHGPNIKLIAFSGYGQEKDKQLAKEAGFNHHATKPIDINELIKLI